MTDTKRLRGLKDLVHGAVENGSLALERVQLERAALPFSLLESIPKIAVPARGVHQIHDAAVVSAHGMVRLVNRVVGETLDVVLDAVEKREG